MNTHIQFINTNNNRNVLNYYNFYQNQQEITEFITNNIKRLIRILFNSYDRTNNEDEIRMNFDQDTIDLYVYYLRIIKNYFIGDELKNVINYIYSFVFLDRNHYNFCRYNLIGLLICIFPDFIDQDYNFLIGVKVQYEEIVANQTRKDYTFTSFNNYRNNNFVPTNLIEIKREYYMAI